MDSFAELTRALQLKEQFENVVSRYSKYPYKQLNPSTARIIKEYLTGGTGVSIDTQFKLSDMAREFDSIVQNIERSKAQLCNVGE